MMQHANGSTKVIAACSTNKFFQGYDAVQFFEFFLFVFGMNICMLYILYKYA